MELFCFASKNVTNIWAGIGARMWAVAETSPTDMKARATKSKRMKVGSLGLLYCNETHSFTTPFLVYSAPDPEKVVSDIWPESWRLPFRIHPLGTPSRQVHMDEAKKRWPVLLKSSAASVSAAMNIPGTTVFVPVEVSADDWAMVLNDLATAL
ncbi:MAG: hypothetical protein HYV18_05185 [Gammaproteobacteria bacterium]|nr:hypothetical protein [Gammaproteobacteria bacterium]